MLSQSWTLKNDESSPSQCLESLQQSKLPMHYITVDFHNSR